MKSSALLLLAVAILALTACEVENFIPRPTPTTDLPAMVEAAVARALPTETPTPTPDIDATVEARMEATRAAMPTLTPTPTATPTPTSAPTPTPTPEPNPTLSPTPQPAATPRPAATATPQPPATPQPTATPTPTPRPTATARPTATPSPPPLSAMISRVRPAVVKIQTNLSTGTGAIFDTQGQTGFVITNHHVIEGASLVRVVVNDSTPYRGTVLGSDPVRDLAIVSICCDSFHSLSLGDVSHPDPGDAVFALGYPLGIAGQATLTRGIVSAIRYDSKRQSEVIQTDAAINPGNSGGPMLSVSGEILGINTFKYSDIGVERLGFAISSKTVRQRIPDLMAGAPKPTITSTQARPTSTPSGGRTASFGPINGDLQHDPTDSFIKSEYAGVTFADVIVEATFVNPYSAATNSWDYGFIIRDSGQGSSDLFIQAIVTSDQRWSLAWREGTNPRNQIIGGGTIPRFDTTAGGRNHLRIVAIGERGWLFANGDFVSTLDFSDVIASGDIAVITGAYLGHAVAGAVTRFENFKISSLARRYGPIDGALEKKPGSIGLHNSSVKSRDLMVEAVFDSPPGTAWDYGFVIRNPIRDRLEVIGVDGEGWWFHHTSSAGDLEYTRMGADHLTHTLLDRNHLQLIAIEESGWFFVNGRLVHKLDLSHNQDSGSVRAMGDLISDHNASHSFKNFNVWAP